MKRILFSTVGLASALLLAALAGPATAAAAGPLTTASSCTGTTTVTCDLWARPGTLALPGTSVTAWGYATTAGGSPVFPGPTIVVDQGASVTINLTNDLPQATSLAVEGLDAAPDLTAVAAGGGTHAYTFTASGPGTYLYEAGILPGSEYQASMGLYGVLVVRPTGFPDRAYAGADTAFADEALVVTSEVDPALNNAAAPESFDLRGFAPRWFLVNGQAFAAGVPAIPVTSGNTLLLRYANAGILHRSMGVLGLHQRVLAADGAELPAQRTMVAETLAPGQAADVLVDLPVTAAASTLYPVYDAALDLNNATASGIGGMLVLLDASGTDGGDTTGPVTSGITFDIGTGLLAATVSDASTGNANVSAAEYFVDTAGAAGSGSAMSGAFGSPSASVSATVPAAILSGLGSGTHTIYVHGQDSLGNWGAVSSVTFTIDTAGPVTSALTLSPNPAGGSSAVALGATASDLSTGGASVTAAEYAIDGGAATPMTLNKTAVTVSATATIPAATIAALAEGSHTVAVRAQDANGNWGAAATVELRIDRTGPTASGLAANPPANNGKLGQSSSNPSVRVTASITDPVSGGVSTTVAGAEGFIDTVGAPGTGFVFTASDGVYGSATETVYADIPLTTINLLSSGNHTIAVRGRDAVGNWGATASLTYLVDRTAPTFSGITLAAINPSLGGGITLTVNGATDPTVGGLASGVQGGEYWIDQAAPAPGGGTPFTGTGPITIGTTLASGSHAVGVRIRDVAGNWSTTASGSVSTIAVAIFSNGFETGNRPWGWTSASTNTTARLNVTTTTVLDGSRSLQAQGNNGNYVQNSFGTTANPAWPTYDARFLFRPNGNASTGQDILSVASNTNFSTVLARVRYRLNAGQAQAQLQVGATANAAWVNLPAATTTVELVWQAVGSAGPNPGTVALYLNGTLAQSLTTTSTASVTAARLGSVTSGGSSTLEYFDAFASKRSVSQLYGP